MPEDIDSPDETDSINIICSRVPKIATWQKRSRLIKFELPLLLETNSIEFKQLFLEVSTIGFRTESYEVEYSFSELDGDGRIQLYVSQLKCPIDSDSSVLNETPIKLLVKVASDTKEVARKEFSIRLLPPVSINASVASAYSVVFHQNQIPLISSLEITNNTDEVYDLVKIKAEFDPSEFKDDFWNIEQLGSSQTVQLNERSLKLSANALTTLKERKIVTLTLSITTEDEVLGLFSYEIELLPKHQWGGERNMPELLAAFITPNTYYTDSLLKKASNMLGKDGHKSGIDGYQSGTRERPWMVAAALWAVVSNEGISYSVPPSSFASNGQKIRTNSEISKTLLATCLDTALLFASCLEQAGLNPVIALTKGHALVGCWLKDESFPNITNDDPSDLRNRIALDDIILFETTLATNDRPVQFKQAIKEGSRHISEDSDDDFVYVIDLKQARSRKINPIDTGDDDSPIKPEAAERPKATLPPPPVLPPINDHDADKEELSPEGRVDQWRRKLLDLSKRNRLLNISQRSTGFRIICPDLGTLEDNLAAGKKYNIVSKEVIETEGRSSEQFTLQTGDHLESEVVKDQLKRQNLVANCSERDLDKDLINLFRRAKSDLEEGGANTLFLTLGMLKWRVDGNSERYFKAPLILLPIKLARTSARAKPKIMQLPDESPVFNTTLIELMLQDYEIDLTKYQTGLPKDESGIDVQRVWSEVRSKIVGSPGFEVTEELFLSNFSFSKYLMWKDLSDRIDELKKSKLVNHLVEKPNETYADLADFRDAREVDKIDPSNLYAPLNADSAQIVAIDASAKGADFVLEGPPGTGKSETISNIIAHNLALGKKVLFVSEKMAALDVVYSRLKKVGLGHACLELHSKKATKKEVISQLKDAWIMRESASVEEWQQKAATLKKARGKLNSYVDELHKESHLGFTPFQAVARHVNKGPFCQVKLDWGDDLNEAPVTTPQEFIGACLRAKNLGLAYKDVVDIDTQGLELINVSDWSFVWQSNLKKEASVLKTNTEKLTEIVSAFAREFGVSEVGDIDYHGAYYWCNIASICLKAPENSIAYAVGSDSTKKLEGLKTLAQLKDSLNELLTQYGLSIGDNYIEQLKIEPW
ncbi:DUF4011 domain-containing protein, partial [Akkermansiaceae bacterium]|nr:DUF4011 domain-containing protein [Akkermansiaceae bacterium]